MYLIIKIIILLIIIIISAILTEYLPKKICNTLWKLILIILTAFYIIYFLLNDMGIRYFDLREFNFIMYIGYSIALGLVIPYDKIKRMFKK